MQKTDLRHYKKFLYRDEENSPIILSWYAAIAQNGNNLYEFSTWRSDIAAEADMISYKERRISDVCFKEWGYTEGHWGKLYTYYFEPNNLLSWLKLGVFSRGQYNSPKEQEYPTFYFEVNKRYGVRAWNIEEILGTKLKFKNTSIGKIWKARYKAEQKAHKAYEQAELARQADAKKFEGLLELDFELSDLYGQPLAPYYELDLGALQTHFEDRLAKYPDCAHKERCQLLLAEVIRKFAEA